MNTKHKQYLEWLDEVEFYYKNSLLRVLESIPKKYEMYHNIKRESERADLLLKDL